MEERQREQSRVWALDQLLVLSRSGLQQRGGGVQPKGHHADDSFGRMGGCGKVLLPPLPEPERAVQGVTEVPFIGLT